MEDEFDVKKDYYQVLGVQRTATADELKAAHIALALKLHPDMQANQQQDNIDRMAREFGLVSEAWQVLSKPSLRSKYDLSRRQYLGLSSPGSANASSWAAGDDHTSSAIPDSHHTQKTNYTSFMKTQDSRHWRENMDKYKTEKWQNLSLHDKKASRHQRVSSMGGTLVGAVVPMLACGAVAYVYFHYYARAGNIKNRLQLRDVYGK